MKLLLNKSKQSGSQLVEYLLLSGILLLVVYIAINNFGDQIHDMFDSLATEISETNTNVGATSAADVPA